MSQENWVFRTLTVSEETFLTIVSFANYCKDARPKLVYRTLTTLISVFLGVLLQKGCLSSKLGEY